MGCNIEIKASLRDEQIEPLRTRAAQLSTEPKFLLHQVDTFFVVPTHSSDNGPRRLKLREFGDGTGELIFYVRPDASGPKPSSYILTPTPDPSGLKAALTASNGIAGVVEKQREVLLIGPTRVHIDNVTELGWFLELEVVLESDQPTSAALEAGQQVAGKLLEEFGVGPKQLLAGAYFDLLKASGGRQ